MSGTLESLRRKIDGAGDLEGVVRSMKALAASSIGQYEKAVQSLDDYYRTVELALIACLHQAGPVSLVERNRPPHERPHEATIGAVVFGSDQGLVGRFNEVIVEFAVHELKTLPGKITKIWAVGDRAHALLADTVVAPVDLLSVPTSVDAITPLIGQILIEGQAALDQGDVGEVYVFHNHPKFGAAYEPVGERLVPLDNAWQQKLAATAWPTKNLPEVIEGAKSALPAFVRGYLFVLLFQACAESLASENASRLAAMQRAEKNITDILEDLNRTFRRVRQESIDEELFDVISGFEALTARPRHT
ncbi:MAG: F0F1 ATP synthase subunit gamma [Terriglobales bacterium]|jgi:F-type H+-transporting ATPase subunit gamma